MKDGGNMLNSTQVALILVTMRALYEGDIVCPELDDTSPEACFVVQCHELLEGVVKILKDNPDNTIG